LSQRVFNDGVVLTEMLLRGKLEVFAKTVGGDRLHQFPKTARPCKADACRVPKSLCQLFDVLRLETFRSLRNGELDAVAFFKSFISITDNRRIMDKYISPRGPFNKPKPLFIVKPLDLARLFAHLPLTPLRCYQFHLNSAAKGDSQRSSSYKV